MCNVPLIFVFKTEKRTAGRADSLMASTSALVILMKNKCKWVYLYRRRRHSYQVFFWPKVTNLWTKIGKNIPKNAEFIKIRNHPFGDKISSPVILKRMVAMRFGK